MAAAAGASARISSRWPRPRCGSCWWTMRVAATPTSVARGAVHVTLFGGRDGWRPESPPLDVLELDSALGALAAIDPDPGAGGGVPFLRRPQRRGNRRGAGPLPALDRARLGTGARLPVRRSDHVMSGVDPRRVDAVFQRALAQPEARRPRFLAPRLRRGRRTARGRRTPAARRARQRSRPVRRRHHQQPPRLRACCRASLTADARGVARRPAPGAVPAGAADRRRRHGGGLPGRTR